MADSDINKLPAYRLGVLETKVDRLQDDVKALDGRVTDLSERVTDMDDRQQSNFRWTTGLIVVGVAVPLNLAILGMLAQLLGLL